jgi:hypothetical protein
MNAQNHVRVHKTGGEVIPTAELELQLREAEERLKAQGVTDPDELDRLAGQEIFECLARQRRYFKGALQRARDRVGGSTSLVDHRHGAI